MREDIMKKARYKVLVTGIIVAAVLAALLLYFRPMKISDLINENQEIHIIQIEMGIQDGEPYMDNENYCDLTKEQREDIIDLFQQYTYRRTPGTAFSDGSLSGISDRIIHLYAYDDGELLYTIFITDTNGLSINESSYVLRDSSGLIQEILTVIE